MPRIADAFAGRVLPVAVIPPDSPPSDVYEDARYFDGRRWQSISAAELEEHSAAVFGFSPEAFKYYLPGILKTSIEEHRPGMMAVDALIQMLDRSDDSELWDEFFIERWAGLSALEYSALKEWLLWLHQGGELSESQLSRASTSLDLLSKL